VRLFLAVDVEARDTLTDVAAAVRRAVEPGGAGRGRSVRWVDPAQMHLTLHFLGDVPDAAVPALTAALAPPIVRAPFDAALGGAGVFPPSGQVRVIWLGCTRGAAELGEVHRLTGQRLAGLGYTLESRPYSAHVTLGRVKDRAPADLRERVLSCGAGAVGPWTVSSVTLYQSRLAPSGAVYSAVSRTALVP